MSSLVEPLYEALAAGRLHPSEVSPERIAAFQALLEASPQQRAESVVLLVGLIEGRKRLLWGHERPPYHVGQALQDVVSRLMRAKLPFTGAQLRTLLQTAGRMALVTEPGPPVAPILGAVERLVGEEGLPDDLRADLEALLPHLDGMMYSEFTKQARRIEKLLATEGASEALPFGDSPLGAQIATWVRGRPGGAWQALLLHAATAAGGSKPTGKWRKEGARLIAAAGAAEVSGRLAAWLPAAELGPHQSGAGWSDFLFVLAGRTPETPTSLSESERDVMKGLVWLVADLDDPSIVPTVARFGERAFKKVAGWGAQSTKLGNAVVWVLGALPDGIGVPHLSRLMSRVRYPSARKLIGNALDAAADAAGVTRDEVEEMSLPDFGLGADGVRREPIGAYTAELRLVGGKATLTWVAAQGKPQKSVPAAVKEQHADALKDLKSDMKELSEVAAGQANRIERLWVTRTAPWRYEDWRERYLDHGLVGPLARGLLWTVDGTTVLWSDGALRDLAGHPLGDIAADSPVTLWHPIQAEPAAILAWRARLEALDVVQPLKQAWRELYRLTPAELDTETYSNRFAAHILRQHQFLAIAQQRGWRYTLQGAWDSHNTPTREIPAFDLRASFWVDPAPDESADSGYTGYAYLASDQARFSRMADDTPLGLEEVPPQVFSEVMRDIDLFVSVCSIGNDPNWADRGPAAPFGGYWHVYAFGDLSETATTRGEALKRLLPRTRLRDVARVEERWLVVRGSLHEYRIHLGSSNIQVDGRGYLCVVPARTARGSDVRLPFDGDSMLSVILSKAFLLADDAHIRDPSILRQIG